MGQGITTAETEPPRLPPRAARPICPPVGPAGARRAGRWGGVFRGSSGGEALGYAKVPGTYDDAQRPGVWPVASSARRQVPLTVAVAAGAGLGPNRWNADRVAVAGTGEPWI